MEIEFKYLTKDKAYPDSECLKSIRCMSSGTMGVLTGHRIYSDIRRVENSFFFFTAEAIENEELGPESTWMDAWELYKIDHPEFTPCHPVTGVFVRETKS